jgi:hypothetical protein
MPSQGVDPDSTIYRIITTDWVDQGVVTPAAYIRTKRPIGKIWARMERSLSFMLSTTDPTLQQAHEFSRIPMNLIFGVHRFRASDLDGVAFGPSKPIRLAPDGTGIPVHVSASGFPNPNQDLSAARNTAQDLMERLDPSLLVF